MHCLVQREHPGGLQHRVGLGDDLLLLIEGNELDVLIAAHLDRAIREHVDGGIQHTATERIAIGRKVGTTAGKADAQWRTRTHLGDARRLIEQRTHVGRGGNTLAAFKRDRHAERPVAAVSAGAPADPADPIE